MVLLDVECNDSSCYAEKGFRFTVMVYGYYHPDVKFLIFLESVQFDLVSGPLPSDSCCSTKNRNRNS